MPDRPAHQPLPAWLLPPFVAGSLFALAGGYWDDAWHTERGRDDFFIAPHIAIYGGISLVAGALTLWLALSSRRIGLRAAVRQRPLQLALLSVGATFVSAPIDNAWHVAFGRDAVIWSPPHVLGIVGTATLAMTVLVELGRLERPWVGPMRAVAGAGVLAPFAFLVIEFDNDVPQFDPVFYLPALALAAGFAFAVIALVNRERLACTTAAATHLGFVLVVAALLALLDFGVPLPPLLVLPALVLDLARRRGSSTGAAALAFAVCLYAIYVPVVNWAGDGVFLTVADVALGLPAAALAAYAVMRLVPGPTPAPRPPVRAAGVAAVIALLSLALAVPALAHDPGQGEEVGELDLVASVDGRRLRLDAEVLGRHGCGDIVPHAVVARRAGRTLRAPLRGRGCRYSGALTLTERGRWFVYAELRRGEETVESWLPVTADGGSTRVQEAGRFAYVVDRAEGSLLKTVLGVALYAAMLALLAAAVRFARRAYGEPASA